MLTKLVHPGTQTLASSGWDAVVSSAKAAASNVGDAKYLLIVLVVLIVFYINLRLARWLSASIKFDPPHHHPHPHHADHAPSKPKHHEPTGSSNPHITIIE